VARREGKSESKENLYLSQWGGAYRVAFGEGGELAEKEGMGGEKE